jgi:hypothetical protein
VRWLDERERARENKERGRLVMGAMSSIGCVVRELEGLLEQELVERAARDRCERE